MDIDTGWLIVSLLISSVGVGLFLYGRKQARLPHLVIGIVLVGYTYFVPSLLVMVLIGAGLIVVLWVLVKAGY